MAQLTWHGHANFRIGDDSLRILIDPWFEGNPSCKSSWEEIKNVDLVLVTHDHGDHLGQALDICLATGAMLGAQVELAGAMKAKGLSQDQVLNGMGFNIGGSVQSHGCTVTMVQAYHSCSLGTPVGFIIQLPSGLCVYHAGDTCIFPGMQTWARLYPIDVALLPSGGTFTMDSRQAAMACSLLNCDRAVPMHWGTFPALEQNTEDFVAHLSDLAPETKPLIMAPGQSVEI